MPLNIDININGRRQVNELGTSLERLQKQTNRVISKNLDSLSQSVDKTTKASRNARSGIEKLSTSYRNTGRSAMGSINPVQRFQESVIKNQRGIQRTTDAARNAGQSLERFGDQARRSTRDAADGARGASRAFREAGSSGARAGNAVANSFNNVKEIVAGILIANIIGGIARAFRDAIGNALDFEKAVAEVNTLLNENSRVTEQTRRTLLSLSAEYGSRQTSQVRAFYDIISAGIQTTATQLEVLRQANETALAGLVDVSTSADVLTSALNAYSESGITAERVSDVLFATVRVGKTRMDELAATIGNVAPIAQGAGVSFAELGGTIAQITTGGIATERAVTGLRAVLAAIVKPSQEARKAAADLGLEFSAAGIKAAGGFVPFLEQVRDATEANIDVLTRLIPQQEAIPSVLSILGGDFNNFKNTIDAVTNSMGATSDAAEQMRMTLDFRLDQTRESINALGIQLLSTLSPAIQTTALFWTRLLRRLGNDEVEETQKSVGELTQEINKLERQIESVRGLRSGDVNPGNIGEAQQLRQREADLIERQQTLIRQRGVARQREAAAAIANNREIAGSIDQINQKQKESLTTAQEQLQIDSLRTERLARQIEAPATRQDPRFEQIRQFYSEYEALEKTANLIILEEQMKSTEASLQLRKILADGRIAELKREAGESQRAAQEEMTRQATALQEQERIRTQAREKERLALEEARALEAQRTLDDQEKEKLMQDERFAELERILGREAALRETFRLQDLEATGKANQAKLEFERARSRNQIALDRQEMRIKEQAFGSIQRSINRLTQAGIIGGRKAARAQKAFGLAQAGVNLAVGLTQANRLGFPLNLVEYARVLTTGIAAINSITSTSIPSFQRGGFVPGIPDGDANLARVSGGEFIANRAQQRRLLDLADGRAGGEGVDVEALVDRVVNAVARRPVNIEIDGREIATTVREQERLGFVV